MTPPTATVRPRATAPSPRRPVPAPDRSRHLKVVRGRPAPGRRPPVWLVTVAVAGTIAALFLVVTANVLVGQAAMRRAAVEQRVTELRLQAEQLQVDVARLRSPARIEQRAYELGLVPGSDVIVLQPGAAPAPVVSGE